MRLGIVGAVMQEVRDNGVIGTAGALRKVDALSGVASVGLCRSGEAEGEDDGFEAELHSGFPMLQLLQGISFSQWYVCVLARFVQDGMFAFCLLFC
jgi:hypothetical protein